MLQRQRPSLPAVDRGRRFHPRIIHGRPSALPPVKWGRNLARQVQTTNRRHRGAEGGEAASCAARSLFTPPRVERRCRRPRSFRRAMIGSARRFQVARRNAVRRSAASTRLRRGNWITEAQIIDVVSFMPERRVVNEPPEGQLRGRAGGQRLLQRGSSSGGCLAGLPLRASVRAVDGSSEDGHPPRDDRSPGVLPASSPTRSGQAWPWASSTASAPGRRRSSTSTRAAPRTCRGLNTARAFVESGQYKRVVVVTVTNFISPPEFQKSRRSSVLGDGASATRR